MNYQEIEKKIGYQFKNKKILDKAFTHSSIARHQKNYEQLEFFGDSFLNFVIAKYLFQTKPYLSVGDMTKMRAQIVCTQNLKTATSRMGLWEYVKLAKTDNVAKENKKMYADIFESIVGGIYIDGGEKASEQFIMRALEGELKEPTQKGETSETTDYKSALQEYIQGKKLGEIKYETTATSGEAHKPCFEISLFIGENLKAKAIGESKKKASQACAKLALENYGVIKSEQNGQSEQPKQNKPKAGERK